MIRTFEQLTDHLQQLSERRRVVVVNAIDRSTSEAVAKALDMGLIDAIFVGGCSEVAANKDLARHECHISLVEAADSDDAAAKAVGLINSGDADVLMKGKINTDNLLRAILNKETGMLPKGNVMTHITVAQLPQLQKFTFFTDPAVIPYPTKEQRISQVTYCIRLCKAFGIDTPKLSLIHCTEKVNTRHFPFTQDYVDIVEMARQGDFGKCVVDGPLDVKTSLSAKAMQTKNIDSPIGGDADVLLFPDIEAANVFYKAITLFPGVQTAGLLQGTTRPVVLPSRGDTTTSKFYSLAAALTAIG